MADDFEDVEWSVPREKLCAANHQVVVVGDETGRVVEGKRHRVTAEIDAAVDGSEPSDFDMLLIPGGYSPDHLRTDAATVSFVRRFCDSGRRSRKISPSSRHRRGTLIDASVLVAAERGMLDLGSVVARHGDQEIAIAAVTAAELLHGVYRAASGQRRMQREAFVERLLEHIPVLPFDLVTARLHTRVWAELAAKGVAIGASET